MGFEFLFQQTLNAQTEAFEQVNGKYTWKSESKDEFIDRLEHFSSLEKLKTLNTNISNSIDNNDIRTLLVSLTVLLHRCIKKETTRLCFSTKT